MIKNWQEALISRECTIEMAIKVIDKASIRVAIVVDSNKKLLGLITDGDIRRGLIKNIKLTEPVSAIMNIMPVVTPEGSSREKILILLEKHKLIQMPLVDDAGRIVGVETLENIAQPKKNENLVLIMVGGYGKRLSPLTYDTPKPLLKVGQHPILQNILETFIANGFYRFYFSVHYKSEMIEQYFGNGEKWGVEINYVREEEPLGTAGSLGYLPTQSSPVLVMNGDLLTKVDFSALLNFHIESDAAATVGVREYDFQVPYGLVKFEGSEVTDLIEKPVYNFFVNAGFYVLSPQALSFAKRAECIDMPVLLKKIIDAKQKVAMFPIHEYWLDIGRMDDFERAQEDVIKYF